MARNLDVIFALAALALRSGASAEKVLREMRGAALDIEMQHDAEAEVPPAATAGEPGEFTFGGATFDPKPAKPE